MSALPAAQYHPVAPRGAVEEPKVPSLRGSLLAAALAIALCFGTFFAWAFTAHLDGAAIAPGEVVGESQRKTVQQLEGGILREILVKEGEFVRAGQTLLRMDDTQASTQFAQLSNQRWSLIARIARLRAEHEDRAEIHFPPELLKDQAVPEVAEAMGTQRSLFAARRTQHDGQIDVLRRRIAQIREEIVGLRHQLDASRQSQRLIEEELNDVAGLVAKGLAPKPRLLALQRSQSDLKGQYGQLIAATAKAEQHIAQTELEIIELGNQRRSEAARELQDARTVLATLEEQMRGVGDVLARREVTAPLDGVVANLRFHTPGGVIPGGAPILDIVPSDDGLVVQAMVSPLDIDNVHAGMRAYVQLAGYKQRKVPWLEGRVIYVSADKVPRTDGGPDYFVARVRLLPEALERYKGVELAPGMPASVSIVTGERLAIDYFLAPITESMHRAFREE